MAAFRRRIGCSSVGSEPRTLGGRRIGLLYIYNVQCAYRRACVVHSPRSYSRFKSRKSATFAGSNGFAQFWCGFRRADVLCAPTPAQAQPVEDGPNHSGVPTVDWDTVMRTSSDSSSSSSSSSSPEVGGLGVGGGSEVGGSPEVAAWSDPCSFSTHVAVGPSRIHGLGLFAKIDMIPAALGEKQSWDDLTSGTALVLTLPVLDPIAEDDYCSFMEKNNVPDAAVLLPSGRVVPLCSTSHGKISKSALYFMNSSSSPATANVAVLHRTVDDTCKIVVEVRKTVPRGQELTWFYGRWLQQ